jgi:hypothetical protein
MTALSDEQFEGRLQSYLEQIPGFDLRDHWEGRLGPSEWNDPDDIQRRIRRFFDWGMRQATDIEIPNGYREIEDDEEVQEGDLHLSWGAWVYVDTSKRYGNSKAKGSTFGGPVIRKQKVDDVLEGEQGDLMEVA